MAAVKYLWNHENPGEGPNGNRAWIVDRPSDGHGVLRLAVQESLQLTTRSASLPRYAVKALRDALDEWLDGPEPAPAPAPVADAVDEKLAQAAEEMAQLKKELADHEARLARMEGRREARREAILSDTRCVCGHLAVEHDVDGTCVATDEDGTWADWCIKFEPRS